MENPAFESQLRMTQMTHAWKQGLVDLDGQMRPESPTLNLQRTETYVIDAFF